MGVWQSCRRFVLWFKFIKQLFTFNEGSLRSLPAHVGMHYCNFKVDWFIYFAWVITTSFIRNFLYLIHTEIVSRVPSYLCQSRNVESSFCYTPPYIPWKFCHCQCGGIPYCTKRGSNSANRFAKLPRRWEEEWGTDVEAYPQTKWGAPKVCSFRCTGVTFFFPKSTLLSHMGLYSF